MDQEFIPGWDDDEEGAFGFGWAGIEEGNTIDVIGIHIMHP